MAKSVSMNCVPIDNITIYVSVKLANSKVANDEIILLSIHIFTNAIEL